MEKNSSIPIVSIVGPTASGKTALSIELAKIFHGEIVSADSMQIYKGMDIATAKPTIDEQQGIKHHMIDYVDITDTYSVSRYCVDAHRVIEDIYHRGKLPILVGGTGLYVDSLLNNISFSQADSDEELREELFVKAKVYGVDYLLDILREFDPCSAQKLEKERNIKRIIRAIEIYKITGITMTESNKNSRLVESPYKVVKLGLTATDRQYLYDRINRRVDFMVKSGLVDEAKTFKNVDCSSTSSMAIGHKELMPYLNNESNLDECIEKLKMQTRRYAKRQLTWFRRDDEINWFNIDLVNMEELVNQAQSLVKKVLFNE